MTWRRGVLAFFILCATFLLAHTINGVIAEALHLPTSTSIAKPTLKSDSSPQSSGSELADQILSSGLFLLPRVSTGTVIPEQPGGIPTRGSLNVASKIKLLGVVMGERGGVSAIIEELVGKRQAFVRLYDTIPDIGEVSEIRRNGIVIRQGDQQELLELLVGQAENVATAQPTALAKAISTAGGIVRKVLDRREVEQALGDLPKLLSQARAAPYLVNGAMNGFRLDYVAPASFYEKIGLLRGDVLQQVNGVEVRDPSTMLTLFQQLRNERNVKVDLLRNNQRTTMNFEIR